VTNTSSSEGEISLSSGSSAWFVSAERICRSSAVLSASKWTRSPNSVASRMNSCDRKRLSCSLAAEHVSSQRRVPGGVTSGRRFNSSGRPLTINRAR
jgi:hypothetical protein